MPGNMASKRILVADDEELIRRNIRDLLTRKGHDVVTCPDGRDALDEFRKRPFDLAIIDLRMPGVQGLELIEEMREHDPNVPVIVLTGYGTVENAVQAIKRGAFNFLCKPSNNADILALVEKGIHLRADLLRAQSVARSAAFWLRVAITLQAESKRAAIGTVLHICMNSPYVSQRFAIATALEEALENALIHGNKGAAEKKVHLSAELDETSLRIRVQDEGDGFDYQRVLSEIEKRDSAAQYGQGLFLVRQCMDRVGYEDGGRTLVLTKFP